MNRKKKMTCSYIRILGNGMMAAGFFVLCVSAGICDPASGFLDAGGNGRGLIAAGMLLFITGFLCKLTFWRCPFCGAHLMLCVRGRMKRCPCCDGNLEGCGTIFGKSCGMGFGKGCSAGLWRKNCFFQKGKVYWKSRTLIKEEKDNGKIFTDSVQPPGSGGSKGS